MTCLDGVLCALIRSNKVICLGDDGMHIIKIIIFVLLRIEQTCRRLSSGSSNGGGSRRSRQVNRNAARNDSANKLAWLFRYLLYNARNEDVNDNSTGGACRIERASKNNRTRCCNRCYARRSSSWSWRIRAMSTSLG